MNPPVPADRQNIGDDHGVPLPSPAEDPDAGLVGRAQRGDLGSFEALVTRHSRRVYRTLIGITGSREDAEDAMQDAFLKAYTHLGRFEGTARFSTWLTRIAINEGVQRLRGRKGHDNLDDEAGADETFRPRQVHAWEADPESLFSVEERRALVEQEIMNLSPMYRLPVILRDMEQLSTEEAASALGLVVPTLKTRLLRGRLMLREALAPHFKAGGKRTTHA